MTAILIPIKTVSEANKREHWAAKARRVRDQRDAVFLSLLASPLSRDLIPEVVRLVRIAPGGIKDDDNLRSSLKAVRDACASPPSARVPGFWQVDDGMKGPIRWEYGQERGEYAVRIEVTQ